MEDCNAVETGSYVVVGDRSLCGDEIRVGLPDVDVEGVQNDLFRIRAPCFDQN
ncbi:hypothetical protein HPP92_027278 [Vanilla planifolia]|uniref:Uncharacterized protein n=1 Tax=Vanilla planifolia TaxID=51239 RepID=A0A835QMJ9_VANPL|nr:hypothetical protein HPP92_027278 [Vanilla planifolia]KAG0476150.1 hypothetical protein HPP92_012991 [Vanilla planifolia]